MISVGSMISSINVETVPSCHRIKSLIPVTMRKSQRKEDMESGVTQWWWQFSFLGRIIDAGRQWSIF